MKTLNQLMNEISTIRSILDKTDITQRAALLDNLDSLVTQAQGEIVNDGADDEAERAAAVEKVKANMKAGRYSNKLLVENDGLPYVAEWVECDADCDCELCVAAARREYNAEPEMNEDR